jgi:siroheme synthase-like protein
LLLDLDIKGERILVIGGGKVAERRIHRLLKEGAEVHLISPQITPRIQKWVKEGKIVYFSRPSTLRDLASNYLLVVISIPDRTLTQRMAKNLRKRKRWVATAHGNGNVHFVAIRNFSSVTFGVTTSGKDPSKAKRMADLLYKIGKAFIEKGKIVK